MAKLNGETIEHLADLAAEVTRLNSEISEREKTVGVLKGEVAVLFEKYNLTDVEAGPYKWVQTTSTRRSIKVDRAEAVLSPKVFASLVETSESTSYRVKPNG